MASVRDMRKFLLGLGDGEVFKNNLFKLHCNTLNVWLHQCSTVAVHISSEPYDIFRTIVNQFGVHNSSSPVYENRLWTQAASCISIYSGIQITFIISCIRNENIFTRFLNVWVRSFGGCEHGSGHREQFSLCQRKLLGVVPVDCRLYGE